MVISCYLSAHFVPSWDKNEMWNKWGLKRSQYGLEIPINLWYSPDFDSKRGANPSDIRVSASFANTQYGPISEKRRENFS